MGKTSETSSSPVVESVRVSSSQHSVARAKIANRQEDEDVILGDERVKDISVVPPSSQEESDQLIPPSAPLVAPLKERVYIPPLPFPQQFQKQKKDRHMLDIMELFKKVHINIPLLDAIKQVPSYVKFLKDICTNKRKFAEHERVMLNEECSAILLNILPPKLKDPGSFTIPCVIGNLRFEKALIDLCASVNLMPLSIFQQLGVEEMQPTSISLQLADRSIKFPLGIIEDMLVKVDRFILPADFIILDMEECREVPIIMGRPFLATAGTIIDVKKGLLTMNVEGESAGFQVFKAMKRPADMEECNRVDIIEQPVHTNFGSQVNNDELKTSLEHPELIQAAGNDVLNKVAMLNSIPTQPLRWRQATYLLGPPKR
ncbi:uncharacterized protein LOC120007309 [Tripterygium wilfordii]|uniref:uncharacterized protein LOC120007309 n=1 Tax=Tripterygium wilfordii TaxID=458696 RepID=UPI0018F837BA|nr:uncharacterized protein LOC120007309 [Tripterygium wilfordii]